jgi:hypothetical protein
MISLSSRQITAIGFVCVVLGVTFPLLMVIQVIPASFFVCFFSFAASTLGLLLGMIGAGIYGIENLE